jgi:hypothetical protein
MAWWMDLLLGIVAFLVILKGAGFLLRVWAEHQVRIVGRELRRQRSLPKTERSLK